MRIDYYIYVPKEKDVLGTGYWGLKLWLSG